MKSPLFLMVFVNVHIHFRNWTRIRIRNPRVTDPVPDPVPDPAKVPDPCGSGSTPLFNATTMYLQYNQPSLKGTLSRDFRPFFIEQLHHSIWAPDPRAKAFLHMASNSRRYSTMKSIFLWSAVSMTPLTGSGRCQCHR
jgi:hypothetical protein